MPRRQNFQRDERSSAGLPRLINRAHAALADEFENFQLRKKPGDFLTGGGTKSMRLSSRFGCRWEKRP